MCEPPETVHGAVNSSSVEDLRDPIPGLFTALTASDEGTNDMWSVVKYPAYESLLHHKNFGVSVDKGKSIVSVDRGKSIVSVDKGKYISVTLHSYLLFLVSCSKTVISMWQQIQSYIFKVTFLVLICV